MLIESSNLSQLFENIQDGGRRVFVVGTDKVVFWTWYTGRNLFLHIFGCYDA